MHGVNFGKRQLYSESWKSVKLSDLSSGESGVSSGYCKSANRSKPSKSGFRIASSWKVLVNTCNYLVSIESTYIFRLHTIFIN